MRTTIEIDDDLIAAVMKFSGARTKRQAVEEALQHRLRVLTVAKAIFALRGTVEWEGNLDALRRAGT